MADAEGDLLVLLLDLALLQNDSPAAAVMGVSPAEILSQVLAFANAYMMMSSRNCLAVFAAGPRMCHLLHLGLGEGAAATAAGGGAGRGRGGGGGGWRDADDEMADGGGGGGGGDDGANGSVFPAAAIHSRLSELIARCGSAGPAPASFALSGALSRALCLIHRLQAARRHHPMMLQPDSQPAAGAAGGAAAAGGGGGGAAGAAAPGGRRDRVLLLSGSPDAPSQYIPVMNAIFSAQRAEVVVDAVALGPEDSSLLQQAAHLTGGLYFRPPRGGAGLLALLLAHFAADTGTRAQLDAAQALGVDFRASCFCHKYVIERGYVCSVCLSIFCRPAPACSTCGTEFAAAAAGAGAGGSGGG